ncbi:dodecin family protein [Dyella lutea]|uniref:Dodecin family protein n=1 Tax=Dyella lutea TaxID=2950441 RepID=A0ABT1FGK8_9GAMM|nr:dodecin family protein [Dyella lutea]MCP1375258.1 dodecin family protein [Dyella lutea]
MATKKSKTAKTQLAKVIEVNAASDKGIEDAVRFGLGRVAKTIGDIRGAWISDIKVCTTPDGKITEWRVDMRVSFIVEQG